MDAAKNLLHKASLLFATSVLCAIPALAQTLQVSTNAVTLNAGQTVASISVTSTAAPITFSLAKTTPSAGWYSISADTTTTPATVTVNLAFAVSSSQTDTFKITNTATPSDVQTVTVNYVLGGGGGGSGTITATPNPLNTNLASGTTSFANITLSTTSATAVGFSIGNWTSTGSFITNVTANQFTVSSSSSAILTVSLSAIGLSNAVYTGQIPITPTGGTSTNIAVQLTVGSGVGSNTFQLSNNVFNFTYPTGTNSGFTTVSSTTTSTFNVSSNVTWLLGNGQTVAFSQFVNNGLTVSLGNAVTTLTTGSYTGTLTISNPLNANDFTIVTVFLSVNSGTLPNLTLNQSSLTFNVAVGATSAPTQFISLSATNGLAASVGFPTSNSSWLAATINSSTLPATISVSVNPSGLVANTYNGIINVTFSGSVNGTQSIPVTLVVGAGSGGVVSGIAPTSLTFYYATGSNVFVPQQTVSVSGSGSISIGQIVVQGNTQWVNASAGPGYVVIGVNSAVTTLTNGSYSATVPIITASGTTNIAINLVVTTGVVLYANPATINVSSSVATPVSITTSDGSSVAFSLSSSASWVTAGTPSSTTTPAGVSIGVNTTGLTNGVNSASVTITAAGAVNSPLTVPVVAVVSGGSSGVLTLSQNSMTFSGAVGGSQPAAQTLTVSAAVTTNFSVSTSIQSGGTNWLTVTPSGSQFTNQTLSVSVNQAGLSAGTYNATISLTVNGVTQNVPVTLTLTGGAVSVSPTSLSFTSTGGSTPSTQSLTISSITAGITGVSFAVTFATTTGGAWLTPGVASGSTLTTPISLSVGVNPAGLAAGTYQGTITITPSSGAVVTVPVTLSVTSAVVSASTASGTTLSFTYQVGSASPASQPITVSGSGASLPFTASASSSSATSNPLSAGWLSVSPTSGVTPATINASVNTNSVVPGTYTGTITVAGGTGATGSATGSTTITVTFTVTAPLPTINIGGVTNAASFVAGSISPGEIITVFGTAIGPSPGVTLALDSLGRVATTLGGVQLTVNGFAAPLIFVSDTQVSAVVPYEIAGFLSATVQVKYLNQTSNGVTVAVTAAAPGVFTANRSGAGPAAIQDANQGFAANGPGNPASKGDTIVMYITGEGQTTPAITGRVTPGTQPFTLPLLVPTVLIDGQPAQVDFYGEAPTYTAGLLQVNLRIPTNARTGDLPLVVRIGGVDSQANVTVSVR